MSKSMQPIQTLKDYCGDGNPVIAEICKKGDWKKSAWRKRVSENHLRDLRRSGVTSIAVYVGDSRDDRKADFTVAELLKRPQQPMKTPASAGTR